MNQISLLGAGEIRALAEELDLHPSKGLGQNFVIDGNVCQKIVRIAQVKEDDHVVEIGPGLGSLTLAILQKAKHVTAIEIDHRLSTRLSQTLISHGVSEEKFTVINQDALATNSLNNPNKLVANLPYNVSVPVLLNFLEKFPSMSSGVVMVQSEVADRLAAKPDSKSYGIPTLKAAWWADLTVADTVSRSVFWPMPNVDSSLVYFTRHQGVDSEEVRKIAFELIDRAFSQRRKMLRSVLSSYHPDLLEALEIAQIEPTIRGESLTISQFAQLARILISR
jgi:16S rRNA (adenine1518-N6/adenine1519-N6)-dimethyltransferase